MKKFGIIGYPLGHSFSPGYFNEKFQNEGIDAIYEKYELPVITDLQAIIDYTQDLCGFNVTIPYKEKVMSYLDVISPEARAIGAVNVVKVTNKDGKKHLEGYNSDLIGFTRSIQPLLEAHHKKALVLGTGGASKAVMYGLHKLGIETMLVSRYQKNNTIQYEQIDEEVMKEYTVIVNCTPCGMAPHFDECPAIPYCHITPKHLLFDLIYNPDETLFLKNGREQGAVTKNGLEMLLLQAEGAWEIWNK
ncbi:MAG: shikimate dehydrogenase [Prevotellaceae bacterium]|nr:shikimate dehydrogenase [Prevotella sp.]MDD7248201.1 shikimate dehydrogenase [Prevotellaceae bacterium]MDY2750329.1 shikimate dehydrogenase [Prevotella sp.]